MGTENRYWLKEKCTGAYKVKRCLASLFGEIRVKTTVKCYLISIKISAILKIQKMTIVGKKENLEMLCIISWIARQFKLHVETSHKVKSRAIVWAINYTFVYIFMRKKTRISKIICTCMSFPALFIIIKTWTWKPWMSIYRWMDEENVTYIHDRILIGLEN